MARLIRSLLTIIALMASAVAAAAQNAVKADVPVVVTAPASMLKPFAMPEGSTRTDVVNRILSIDIDGDDRIARHELPERMQGLVDRGDLNGDGFLMAQEIERLIELASLSSPQPNVFSLRKKPAGLSDVISDLRLPQTKHDSAMALVRNHTVPRNVNNPASIDEAQLYERMRELLDDEEFENFTAAARRLKSARGVVTLTSTVVVRP